MKIQKISGNQEIEFLDFLNFLKNNRKIEIIKTKKWLKVRYLRLGRGGSHSKWIYLPKTMRISRDFVKAIGIYYSEGDKSKNRSHTRFANSEISVIKAGIVLFKALGIGEEILKGYIKTYDHEISDEDLIKYWSNASGIPKDNFFEVARYTSREIYIRNRPLPSKYGRIEVYFSNVMLRDIVDALIKLTKQSSLRDQQIASDFLKGLVAGEGSIKLVKNKLREVRIASCNDTEQVFIRRLLRAVNIKPSAAKYRFYVAISGLENFKKLNDLCICELHPDKDHKFNIGFRNLALGE